MFDKLSAFLVFIYRACFQENSKLREQVAKLTRQVKKLEEQTDKQAGKQSESRKSFNPIKKFTQSKENVPSVTKSPLKDGRCTLYSVILTGCLLNLSPSNEPKIMSL